MSHQQVKIDQGQFIDTRSISWKVDQSTRDEMNLGAFQVQRRNGWRKKWKYQVTPKSFPIKNILEAGFSFLVLLPRMKKFFFEQDCTHSKICHLQWQADAENTRERKRECARARVCVRRCKRERDNFCLKFEPMSKLISNLAKKWNIARIFFPNTMPQKFIKNLEEVAQIGQI